MKDFFQRFLRYLKTLVNFSGEMDYENASTSIRKNITFKGPNLIILACAIIIASVGLNVNSIPVIIGAMLISPVMGPILGFGLGLGTEDNHLVKNSLKNYGVMVAISIIASALFFLLSPLSLAHPSELLARTNPTIYDVLIALFGGLAGIIETSRKDKGTVISGVAIATALMPPLCTVGYGISIWKGQVIFGALYLFLINSIFIALATFAAVKYFRFPAVEAEGEMKRLPKKAVYIIFLLVLIPSIFSAIRMVKENKFEINVENLVSQNKAIGKGFIYDYETHYNSKTPTVELFMAGEALSEIAKEKLYANAEHYGITRNQIIFHEDATNIKENLSEAEIVKSIYERSDQQIKALSDSIIKLDKQLNDYKEKELPVEAVSKELFAQYSNINGLSLTRGATIHSDNQSEVEQIVAFVTSTEPLTTDQKDRIERWLKVRLDNENVMLVCQSTNTEKAAE